MPGGDAEHPGQIPARGWRQIAKRGWKEAKADNVPLLGAGVAFYAFLALFPAADRDRVDLRVLRRCRGDHRRNSGSVTKTLPPDAQKLIIDQVATLTARGRSTIGVGALVAILISLFSASAGINNLMTAINIAYDEDEERSAIKKRLISLALTVGAVIFLIIVLALIGVLPPLLRNIFGTSAVRWVLQIAGILIPIVIVSVALACLVPGGA